MFADFRLSKNTEKWDWVILKPTTPTLSLSSLKKLKPDPKTWLWYVLIAIACFTAADLGWIWRR